MTRIQPLGADSSKKGGKADVELAYLSLEKAVAGRFETVGGFCVAVKKFRFDEATRKEARVLAVSVVTDSRDGLVGDIMSNFQSMSHEISLLSKLSHSNIVNLVGFVEDVKEGIAWMIFPWESNGNLREYLQSFDLEVPERVSLVCTWVSGQKEHPTSHHSRHWTWLKGLSTFTI